MFKGYFNSKKPGWFILIASLFFALMFTIEQINGRFWLNDFKVMYLAAEALLNQTPIYDTAFGLSTGFYKYSPFTLFFFTPFTLLNYAWASSLDFIAIACSTIILILTLEKIIGRHMFTNKRPHFIVFCFVLGFGIVHLVRELHLGNTNIFLLLLLTLALKLALAQLEVRASALLAIVILTKPYFAICLLPFWLFKHRKMVWYTLGTIGIYIGFSLLILGPSKGLVLYQDWFSAMMAHSTYLESNNTLFSLTSTYLNFQIPVQYATYTLGGLALVGFGYFWLLNRSNRANEVATHTSPSLIVFFFCLIALVPNVLVTDTEHFLFSLPLVTLSILYARRLQSTPTTVFLMVLLLTYGTLYFDWFGKETYRLFSDYGVLGIGNLILIIFTLRLHYLYRNNWDRISNGAA